MTSLSRDQLADLLRAHGCPLRQWGRGPAKTLDHLLRELAAGECRLVMESAGLCREVPGAQVRVRYRDLTLVEDHQRFTDGRPDPVRRRDLQASAGEKLLHGEDPERGARRALSEELGIAEPVTLHSKQLLRKSSVSESYPGLTTRFETWTFETRLPDSCFRPDGYREQQPDKTTVWVWVPTADAPF